MLIVGRTRRFISFDETLEDFFDLWRCLLGLARKPSRGNRGEKCYDVDLAVTAGLFQHAAHLGSYRIRGSSAVGGDVVDGLAGGETARDARLGGRQVEQRLHQFDRRRSGQRHGGQY
jgi:hypothetical protein